MCECSYSWRPPVICGILVALVLIPLGIDKTWENFRPQEEPQTLASSSGPSAAPPKVADVAKYEGPLMIGIGTLSFFAGVGLGIRAYFQRQDINRQARERHERELRELEEGPPPECMLVIQKEEPESSRECSPSPSVVGTSTEKSEKMPVLPTKVPENNPPGKAVPLKDMAKRSLLDSSRDSPEEAVVIESPPIYKSVPQKCNSEKSVPPRHPNKNVAEFAPENADIPESAQRKPGKDDLGRWGGGISRREDLLPGEIPIPLSTPPLYRMTEDGGYWMTSFSDLSTVGEESCSGIDNHGFEPGEDHRYRTRSMSDYHYTQSKDRKKVSVHSADTHSGDLSKITSSRLKSRSTSSSSRSSPKEVPTRGNTKNTSRGNASSNKDRRIDTYKAKESRSPAANRHDSRIRSGHGSGDSRLKRRENDPLGYNHVSPHSEYSNEQLRSSTSEQMKYEHLMRERPRPERQSDSTYRDSEGDSAYFTHGPDDLSDLERPSAPGPSHRRNASRERERGKVRLQKKQSKPRNCSASSSEYYQYLNGDDAVFLDSPSISRKHRPQKTGESLQRVRFPRGSGSPQDSYQEPVRSVRSSEAISRFDSARYHSEVSPGVVLRAAELRHHQRSYSGSYVPRTSRPRDSSDRPRGSVGHQEDYETRAERRQKTQTLPEMYRSRNRDVVRRSDSGQRDYFVDRVDHLEPRPQHRKRIRDPEERRHRSPSYRTDRRPRVHSDGASPLAKARYVLF